MAYLVCGFLPRLSQQISVNPPRNNQEQNVLIEGPVLEWQMHDACIDYHTYQLGMNTSLILHQHGKILCSHLHTQICTPHHSLFPILQALQFLQKVILNEDLDGYEKYQAVSSQIKALKLWTKTAIKELSYKLVSF